MYEKERRIRTSAPSYVFDFLKSVSQKFAGIFTIILGSVVSLVHDSRGVTDTRRHGTALPVSESFEKHCDLNKKIEIYKI